MRMPSKVLGPESTSNRINVEEAIEGTENSAIRATSATSGPMAGTWKLHHPPDLRWTVERGREHVIAVL